ncbi:MAG TPA: hypothetical protein VKR31_17025, partial [Rhizomicrobium sp.]|nr:hypothetical protein [Rhizomicrobium sp.]
IADFNKAVERDPDNAETFDRRGLAFNAQGDRAHAIADYDRAIALDPGDDVALENLCLVQSNEGDGGAGADCNKSARSDSGPTRENALKLALPKS